MAGTRSIGGQSWLYGVTAFVAALLALFPWARDWFVSGAGPATYLALACAAHNDRVLPSVGFLAMIATLNLIYAIAATSWLLYGVFAVLTYPAVVVISIFEFPTIGGFVRRRLRSLLIGLQFTRDKIALFNLPALEIDRDVDGLLVIRGATITLSSLTLVVHGVEVGIKFSDDLELAMVVDTVTVRLFQGIHISDVYANVKGGQHEMSFANLDTQTHDSKGSALMNTDTPLLRAAAVTSGGVDAAKVPMTEEMTDNSAPADSTAKEVMQSIEQLSPDEKEASVQYERAVKTIEKTSVIRLARDDVLRRVQESETTNFDPTKDDKGFRAAICSNLHTRPTIAHPPKQSIKVTTLQTLSSPSTRRFMHRLPLLLRLLLNPIAYFHPIHIESITAGASGKWAETTLQNMVFSQIGDSESDIKHLKARILSWLADANFAVQLLDISASAQVPIATRFDIASKLIFADVMAYRAQPDQVSLRQVLRLGGADAAIDIPSFLLPHHEHLLPKYPTDAELAARKQELADADGKPKTVQAQASLAQLRADETNMKLSVHAHLPAVFDQDLLNFVSALVKATKIIEIERDDAPPSSPASPTLDPAKPSLRGLTKQVARHVGDSMRDGIKKAAVDATVNDRWIARLVGKVTRRLETAQGDVGYSGNVPIALKVYRDNARGEAPKILP